MITVKRRALFILGLGLLAACGGSKDTKPPVPHTFDGTWVACRNDAGTDYREVFTVTGSNVGLGIVDYGTTDVSCDGDGTPQATVVATAVYGSPVTAGFGAGNVLATPVDLTLLGPPQVTFYTLAYLDTAASPEALHLGDDTGALDGSTPALRPVTLQSMARALQATPVAGDLTGEWRHCPPAAGGEIATFNAGTGAFDLRKYSGTCGVGTPVEQLTGTFALATPAYASLGATTVTAFAVDLAVTSPAAVNVYTTFWVDTQVTPRRLYHGDDALHGMIGTSPSLRPRVLSSIPSLKQ